MSEPPLPPGRPAGLQPQRRKQKKHSMSGIVPKQYHNQSSYPLPQRSTVSRSISTVPEFSRGYNSSHTTLGPTSAPTGPAEFADEKANYKIRSTSSEPRSATLLRLTDLLFSESYLQALVSDPRIFPRFTAFLKQYKPALLPILVKYIEYQKILKAVEYANAVASTINRYPESNPTSSSAVELSSYFRASIQPTLDALLSTGLPAWATYNLVKITTSSLAADITNEATPLTRDIVRGLGEAFCITDPNREDNPIVYASEEFYKVTGYGRDGVIGRNCRFLQGPKTKPGSVERLRDAAKKGEGICETLLNYRRDATPFVNMLMMTPLHDEKGVLRYYLGAQVDVSRLVESGRGVEGFRDFLAKNEEFVDRGRSTEEKLDPKQDIRVKQRNLSDLFDFEDHSVIQKQGRYNSHTISRRTTNEGIERTPSPSTQIDHGINFESESGSSMDHNAPHEILRETTPPKLPGIYNSYLLIRPYPSLRTIFVSHAARQLGQFQQRPFLAHVAAPQSTLTELKDAFKSGTPITAQIALMGETAISRDGTISGSWDKDDGPTSHGNTCWVSATPLFNSEDKIGIWIIVIVDKSNAETNAAVGFQEMVSKENSAEILTDMLSPPGTVSILPEIAAIPLNDEESVANDEDNEKGLMLRGMKADASHSTTFIDQPVDRTGVSVHSFLMPEAGVDYFMKDEQVVQGNTHDSNAEFTFLLPEASASLKRSDEYVGNNPEIRHSSPQMRDTDSSCGLVRDIVLTKPLLVPESRHATIQSDIRCRAANDLISPASRGLDTNLEAGTLSAEPPRLCEKNPEAEYKKVTEANKDAIFFSADSHEQETISYTASNSLSIQSWLKAGTESFIDADRITDSKSGNSHRPPNQNQTISFYSEVSPVDVSARSEISSIADSSESIGREKFLFSPSPRVQPPTSNPPLGINHVTSAKSSLGYYAVSKTEVDVPLDDQEESFCHSTSPHGRTMSMDPRSKPLYTESWLDSPTESTNEIGSPTQGYVEEFAFPGIPPHPPISNHFLRPRFSPPSSPTLSSTSSESLDLDPDLLRERKLNGMITSITPRKHREYSTSTLIPPPEFMTIRESISFELDNVLRGTQEHDSFEAERPQSFDFGKSESTEIPGQNIYVVESHTANNAAAVPSSSLSPHGKSNKSLLEKIFPVKEKNSLGLESGQFVERQERDDEQSPEPKSQARSKTGPRADHWPPIRTKTFTLDPHKGVWKAVPLYPLSVTKMDHDTKIAEHVSRSPSESDDTVVGPLDFLAMRSRIIQRASWDQNVLGVIEEDEESEGGRSGSSKNEHWDWDRERRWGVEGSDGKYSEDGLRRDDDEEREEKDEWADAQTYLHDEDLETER